MRRSVLRISALGAALVLAIVALAAGTGCEADRDGAASSADRTGPAAPQLSPPPSAPARTSTPGLLTRVDAIAKAPHAPGDTLARIEAKLVVRTDLADASNGIVGVGTADYVWVVAQWGLFDPARFGAPLVLDKRQAQQTEQPDRWRFVLIDARTGDAYLGGGSAAEATWWSGLPDRSSDPVR